jgi:hypothetical protein
MNSWALNGHVGERGNLGSDSADINKSHHLGSRPQRGFE